MGKSSRDTQKITTTKMMFIQNMEYSLMSMGGEMKKLASIIFAITNLSNKLNLYRYQIITFRNYTIHTSVQKVQHWKN